MADKLRHRFLGDQRGAVAATYALALIPLIAIGGLAFDYARLAGMETELQNAADQAALAGATQLDRKSNAMQRAINAIQGGLVENSTAFSNDGSGATVDITDSSTQIIFYSNRADAEAGTNGFTIDENGGTGTSDADAGFVEVIVDTRDARYAFTPIVGAIKGSLNARAVAGLGSAVCRVPPLMICNPDEQNGDLVMDVANRVGYGLLAKPGGGGSWEPGNYGYLDVGLANGAVGVRQALGWGAAGNCIEQVGPSTVDTQTGNIANAPGAANTRFDVYENGACEAGGDCPSAINVRKDMVRPASAAAGTGKTCEVDKTGWQLPYQGTSGSGYLGDAYLPTDATVTYTHTPKSMGHPRDKCHAVYEGAPGDCRDTLGNGNFGNGAWDRDTYFRVYYGASWDWRTYLDGAAETTTGALLDYDNDGSLDHTVANVSRYEVYKWEEKYRGTLVGGVTVLGDRPYAASNNGDNMLTKGQSMCSAAHGYTPLAVPDRRKLSVAVVNCRKEGVSGSSTNVPVVQWVDVFLVQVAADRQYNGRHFTGKDEIYVEIIGENTTRDTGATDGITIRRDVPYLVK